LAQSAAADGLDVPAVPIVPVPDVDPAIGVVIADGVDP
jgi:hypothetical protein